MTRRPAPQSRPKPSSPGERGFTLLETLVALTILSLSVAVLFGIFSQGLAWTRADAHAMEARVLAQSLLARAESVPPVSDLQGRERSGLWWRIHVAPVDAQSQPAAGLRSETVTAAVHWMTGEREQTLALSTVLLTPAEAQQ